MLKKSGLLIALYDSGAICLFNITDNTVEFKSELHQKNARHFSLSRDQKTITVTCENQVSVKTFPEGKTIFAYMPEDIALRSFLMCNNDVLLTQCTSDNRRYIDFCSIKRQQRIRQIELIKSGFDKLAVNDERTVFAYYKEGNTPSAKTLRFVDINDYFENEYHPGAEFEILYLSGELFDFEIVFREPSSVFSEKNDQFVYVNYTIEKPEFVLFDSHKHLIKTLCINGDHVYSIDHGSFFKLWDKKSGRCLTTVKSDNSLNYMCRYKDSVIVSAEDSFIVFDPQSNARAQFELSQVEALSDIIKKRDISNALLEKAFQILNGIEINKYTLKYDRDKLNSAQEYLLETDKKFVADNPKYKRCISIISEVGYKESVESVEAVKKYKAPKTLLPIWEHVVKADDKIIAEPLGYNGLYVIDYESGKQIIAANMESSENEIWCNKNSRFFPGGVTIARKGSGFDGISSLIIHEDGSDCSAVTCKLEAKNDALYLFVIGQGIPKEYRNNLRKTLKSYCAVFNDKGNIYSVDVNGKARLLYKSKGEGDTPQYYYAEGCSKLFVFSLQEGGFVIDPITKKKKQVLKSNCFSDNDIPDSGLPLLAVSADCKYALFSLNSETACYSVEKREMIWKYPSGSDCADFTGKGSFVCFGTKSGEIVVYNAESGEKQYTVDENSARISTLSFADEDLTLTTIQHSNDGTDIISYSINWKYGFDPNKK